MRRELRMAVRSLARRRGLSLAIVVTLTLGIGATSAVFSAIDTVLLKPLPYPSADRLVAVFETYPGRPQATTEVAAVRLGEWSRSTRTFEGLAGCYFENVTTSRV